MLKKEFIRNGSRRIIVSTLDWMLGDPLFSLSAEGAVVLFTGNVHLISLRTFMPVVLGALGCSLG